MAVNHLNPHDSHWIGNSGIVPEALCLPETVVKENKQRRVTALGAPKPVFYLKEDKTHGFRNRFKRLFRDRIQTEFKTGLSLEKAGIPVVSHLAWAKKGINSYLLTRAFPGKPFSSFWPEIKGDKPAEHSVVAALAEMLKGFFEKSFYHPDLHGGNLLVDASQSPVNLCFVDVYGIQRRRLRPGHLIEMLIFLFSLTEHWPAAEQKKVFSEFLDFFPGLTSAELFEDVAGAFTRRLYKWRRTRLSKYLTSSSACEVWDMDQGEVISRRETDRALVEKLFADPAVKQGQKELSQCIPVETGGRRYMIRRFNGHSSPGRQAWLKGISLEVMDVPTVKSLAWVRGKNVSWIIMEDPETANLADCLAGADSAHEKFSYLAAAARLVLRLHRRGIVLDDLNLSHLSLKQNHELIINNHDSLHLKSSPPSDGRKDRSGVELFLIRVCEHCAKLGISLPEGVSPDLVKNDPMAALNNLAGVDKT